MTSFSITRASSDSTIIENLTYCYERTRLPGCSGGTATDNVYSSPTT